VHACDLKSSRVSKRRPGWLGFVGNDEGDGRALFCLGLSILTSLSEAGGNDVQKATSKPLLPSLDSLHILLKRPSPITIMYSRCTCQEQSNHISYSILMEEEAA
jgi:hypothetical protein